MINLSGHKIFSKIISNCSSKSFFSNANGRINNPKTLKNDTFQLSSSASSNKAVPSVPSHNPPIINKRSARDAAYSYEIKNSEQVAEMLKEAQKYYDKLPAESADTYKDLISNIQYDSNGNIDIESVDTMKAFLALKKIIKYKGEIPVINNRINETIPLLGDYYAEYSVFKGHINANSDLKNAMSEMYESLYRDDDASSNKHIIPRTQSGKADVAAKRILQEEMQKYSIDNPEKLFTYSDFRAGVMYTCDIDNEFNDWNLQILIKKGGYGNEKYYTPQETVLLHELYHVKQKKPGQKENNRDNFVELGATINQMIMDDRIYKEINNININQEVNYPDSNFKLPNGDLLNFGTIANTFREIMQENNFKTVEEAMISPKGQEFIMKNYGV